MANVEKEDRLLRDDMSCMKCDRKFPLMRAAIRLRSSAVSSPLLKGNDIFLILIDLKAVELILSRFLRSTGGIFCLSLLLK